MPKDKLLRIINNNERDSKSLLKSKKEETKKGLYKPTRNNPIKLKVKKLIKVFTSQQKKIF